MDVHTALSAGATTGFGHATYYSYDVHGNVDHLVQDVPDLAAVSNQYKHLYYQYDLISGKVNQVDYSPGQRDEYHHRYTYDADNRIVQVETSKDAILWDKDANYQYYKHGPLSRAELGDLKVQGLDYAYTIQGWIKGVNSNTMSAVRDPGRDGDLSLGGNTHAKVATDAFGYTLGYFAGDYNPIGTFTTTSKFEASTTGSDMLAARSDLWNGNISHMVTCLPKASDYATNQTITPEAFGSAYQYYQLNRLASSRVFTNINTTINQWQSGAGTNPTAYATDYTYDAMGNILTQKRNGGGASATALDELTYNYHTTTDGLVSNRLYQVNDVVSAGNYSDDIDDQGTFNNTHSTIETANNYGYDELGNLVRDAQEEIASIEWTVYGKMKKITRNSGSTKADLEFGYDASGNRLWKKVSPKGSGAVTSTYYYLRDAQGNEMCRYVKYTNTSSQLMYVAEEHSIYGSSRVGVDGRKDTLYMGGVYTPTWGGVGTSRRALGLKSFELANHLGNVLVTVSDKPIYKVSSGVVYFNPEISSISDYYPFGAPIQGRSAAFGNDYRFGFNGKEGDGEAQTQDYGFRVFDPRLGRFLSVDPLTRKYPMLTPYQFASNMPIAAIDLDGLEAYIVVFPDYKISTKLGKRGGLGHAGSLIVDPTNGDAYYVEYGRYDKEGKGVARTLNSIHKVGTVQFGEDGLPTEESLSQVFSVVSKEAGHGGRIEAAEVPLNQDEFAKAKEIHEKKLEENNNPDREPYKLLENNCGTFSCDVVQESKENSTIPENTSPRPVKMIKEVIKSGATRVGYDPKTGKTTRGGEYIPSEDEQDMDKEIEQQGNGG